METVIKMCLKILSIAFIISYLLFNITSCKQDKKVNTNLKDIYVKKKNVIKSMTFEEGESLYMGNNNVPVVVVYRYSDSLSYNVMPLICPFTRVDEIHHSTLHLKPIKNE